MGPGLCLWFMFQRGTQMWGDDSEELGQGDRALWERACRARPHTPSFAPAGTRQKMLLLTFFTWMIPQLTFQAQFQDHLLLKAFLTVYPQTCFLRTLR